MGTTRIRNLRSAHPDRVERACRVLQHAYEATGALDETHLIGQSWNKVPEMLSAMDSLLLYLDAEATDHTLDRMQTAMREPSESFMFRVAGKPFTCTCGGNVFHQVTGTTSRYACNACSTTYEAEHADDEQQESA